MLKPAHLAHAVAFTTHVTAALGTRYHDGAQRYSRIN